MKPFLVLSFLVFPTLVFAQDVVHEAPVPRRHAIENDLAVGFMAGFDYMFPYLHYQRAVSDRFAIGLQPTFSSGGGFATLQFSFYPTVLVRGPYVSAGAGVLTLSAKVAAAGYANLGWRIAIAKALRLSASVGGLTSLGLAPQFAMTVSYLF